MFSRDFDPRLPAVMDGALEINSDEAQRAAALDGAGLIYVPRGLILGDLPAGQLIEALAAYPTPELPIYVVHPSRRLVPWRVTALIEAIAAGLCED